MEALYTHIHGPSNKDRGQRDLSTFPQMATFIIRGLYMNVNQLFAFICVYFQCPYFRKWLLSL